MCIVLVTSTITRLPRVFARAQLPIDGHKKDEKHPATTKKTFSAMGLKFQNPDTKGEKRKKKKEEEKKKKKKKEKKKEPKRRQPPLQKVKSKPLKNSKRKGGVREVFPRSLRRGE